jgi:aspartate carbamoyltransferase catalytic subunit
MRQRYTCWEKSVDFTDTSARLQHLREFEPRLDRPIMMKVQEFQRNNRLKHVIFSAQFDRELLDRLTGLATMIRQLARSRRGSRLLRETLCDKSAMLQFTQASTRTFLSFVRACQHLGVDYAEIRNPAVSSAYKGESDLDSIMMFSTYFDIVILRDSMPKLAECFAYKMNDIEKSVPIVNGGSGADEHPTQALLDYYTIQEVFKFRDRESDRESDDRNLGRRLSDLRTRWPNLRPGMNGKTYLFCGDVGRSRTIRSLAELLAQHEDVTMYFVGPEHPRLSITPDLQSDLVEAGVTVHERSDLNDCIGEADLVYMTRVQHEHDDAEVAEFLSGLDRQRFILDREMLAKMREYAAILHPFPRNDEISPDIDSDPRAMYFAQAENGMWIRAALIAHLLDAESEIMLRYQDFFKKERRSWNEQR